MTVKELVEKLKNYDQNLEVFISIVGGPGITSSEINSIGKEPISDEFVIDLMGHS